MSRIEELRALEARATKPPWRTILPGDTTWGDRRKYRCVAFDRETDYDTSPMMPQDAYLIVALRNAAPALIELVDAAKAVCDPMIQDGGGDRWWDAHEALRAALEKVEAG